MSSYGSVKIPVIIVPEVHHRAGMLKLPNKVPPYNPVNLTQFEWAWLATQRADILKAFIDAPYDEEAIGSISDTIEGTDLFMPGLVMTGTRQNSDENSYDLTNSSSEGLMDFYDGNKSAGSYLSVIFQRGKGLYRVLWNRPGASESITEAARELAGENLVISVISSSSIFKQIEPLLSPQDISDIIVCGARMLIVSNEAVLRPPKIVLAPREVSAQAIAANPPPPVKPQLQIKKPIRKPGKSDGTMRESGVAMAARLLEHLVAIDPQSALHSPNKKRPKSNSPAYYAHWILSDIAALEPEHPRREAFIEEIGETLAKHDSLFGFVNSIHALNALHPESDFATLISPRGLVEIVRPDSGLDYEYFKPPGAPRLAHARQGSLASNNMTVFLEDMLPYVSAGPDFSKLCADELLPKLLYGGIEAAFPRMEVALPWIVRRTIAKRQMSAQGLAVVEHSPGISPTALTVFARMGTKVGWREPDAAKRLETEFVLAQLPVEVREAIEYVPESTMGKPDISIFNMPTRDTMIDAGARGLFGGVIISQHRKRKNMVPEGLDNLGEWKPGMNFSPGRGDYVLPSASLAMGISSSIVFQTWHAI